MRVLCVLETTYSLANDQLQRFVEATAFLTVIQTQLVCYMKSAPLDLGSLLMSQLVELPNLSAEYGQR